MAPSKESKTSKPYNELQAESEKLTAIAWFISIALLVTIAVDLSRGILGEILPEPRWMGVA